MAGNLLGIVLGIALVATLGACSREPDASGLRIEIQRRLDEDFQAGLFQLTSLRRSGSAPFRAIAGRSPSSSRSSAASRVWRREPSTRCC